MRLKSLNLQFQSLVARVNMHHVGGPAAWEIKISSLLVGLMFSQQRDLISDLLCALVLIFIPFISIIHLSLKSIATSVKNRK